VEAGVHRHAWLVITDGYPAETPKFRRFRTISPEHRNSVWCYFGRNHTNFGRNAGIPEIPEYLTETPKPEFTAKPQRPSIFSAYSEAPHQKGNNYEAPIQKSTPRFTY